MNGNKLQELQARYADSLKSYVNTHSESALFSISKLSKEFMAGGLGPDDVTNMHSMAMSRIIAELNGDAAANAFHSSTEPLLEIMMNYAMSYHSHMEKHKKQLAEYEGGDNIRELERLASVGLLLLGVTGEMLHKLESITDYTDMITKGSMSKAKELSQVIKQQASQSKEMAKTGFLYSRMVAKRSSQNTMVNVNDLLIESIDVIRNAVRLDSVAIQTNYRMMAKINVDPAEMQQALVNIIASAIDAMQGSGNLMISTTIEEQAGQQNIVLRIIASNNGTAKRNDMFSLPMAKANVGLNIAGSILNRLGGKIDIEENETGITIHVRFPVASKANDFIGGSANFTKQPIA